MIVSYLISNVASVGAETSTSLRFLKDALAVKFHENKTFSVMVVKDYAILKNEKWISDSGPTLPEKIPSILYSLVLAILF